MPLSNAHKSEIERIVDQIIDHKYRRRQLSTMFMELPDREEWQEYYEVIPDPRCLKDIKENLAKSKYKSADRVFTDLELVFLNALHYNEEGSGIAKDAEVLKDLLRQLWEESATLSPPPEEADIMDISSPPPPKSAPSPPPAAEAPIPVKRGRGRPPRNAATAAASTPAKTNPAPAASSSKTVAQTPQSVKTSPLLPATQIRSATTSAPVLPRAQTPPKPVIPSPPPTLRTSPRRTANPPSSDYDMDVDGPSGALELEHEMHEQEEQTWEERDPDSENVIRQLEKGLRRWEGPSDRGFMGSKKSQMELNDILFNLRNYKDASGVACADVLDQIPSDAAIPNLSFSHKLSLSTIEEGLRAGQYKSAAQFDKDLTRLFEKGRLWYEAGTEHYGRVLHLQRLYHALTSPSPPADLSPNENFFASIHIGPGNVIDSAGVTSFRVSQKDRTFVDVVDYKGSAFRIGDWVHVINPDDASRPIIAQIFRVWVREERARKDQMGLTLCWYYRPEQTVHPPNRQFWAGEVFKTGHNADHIIEDVIEKIAVQFTARHIRGRPRPPFWYPGIPLYVCDSRYNDKERVFVRIKNWNSCIPEELRKSADWMPIYPFERTVYPARYPSPFLRGITGPGALGEALERGDGDPVIGGGTGRRRSKRLPEFNGRGVLALTDLIGPSRGTLVTSAGLGPGQPTLQLAPLPANMAYPAMPVSAPSPAPRQSRNIDRSLVTTAGGQNVVQATSHVDKLPPETAKLFDRDPDTNEVLWFSGPPVDIAKSQRPQYSLKYLAFLARGGKRKRDPDFEPSKRPRMTVSQSVNEIWEELFGQNGEHVTTDVS